MILADWSSDDESEFSYTARGLHERARRRAWAAKSPPLVSNASDANYYGALASDSGGGEDDPALPNSESLKARFPGPCSEHV